jgi:hypothetical protein
LEHPPLTAQSHQLTDLLETRSLFRFSWKGSQEDPVCGSDTKHNHNDNLNCYFISHQLNPYTQVCNTNEEATVYKPHFKATVGEIFRSPEENATATGK